MKTLTMWKKEIDEGIARGKADIKAGRVYNLDENFMKNIKNEVKKEKLKSKNIEFLFSNKNKGILV